MTKPLQESIKEQIRIVALRRKRKYLHKLKNLNISRKKYNHQPLDPNNPINFPKHWITNDYHNPYYILENITKISKDYSSKIKSQSYSPSPPIPLSLRKKNGDIRTVSVFNIIDESISLLFFKSLVKKNSPIFNNHSYGYRSELTIYDSINYISRNLSGNNRTYIAEYDFSKYFDSIRHEYIFNSLVSNRYYVTRQERFILQAFLKEFGSRNNNLGIGIPQGTAISMFLANLALTELDDQLESNGLSFSRFADDLLIWDKSYERISTVYDIIQDWSKKSGASLNYTKSRGIQIFHHQDLKHLEFKHKTEILYLNHVIQQDLISISNRTIKEVKAEISLMIHTYLIKDLIDHEIKKVRIDDNCDTPKDKDYISLIWSLRRLVYGKLSESEVTEMLRSGSPKLTRLSGRLSSFVASTNYNQLKDLDNWFREAIYNALRKRRKLIESSDINLRCLPREWTVSYIDLLNYKTKSKRTEQIIDLTIPSFFKLHNLSRKLVDIHGSEVCRYSKNIYSTSNNY